MEKGPDEDTDDTDEDDFNDALDCNAIVQYYDRDSKEHRKWGIVKKVVRRDDDRHDHQDLFSVAFSRSDIRTLRRDCLRKRYDDSETHWDHRAFAIKAAINAGSSSSVGGSSRKHAGAAGKKRPREEKETSGATLADKVGRIKRALQLDEKLSMPAAIKKANKQMGLQDKGKTLPDQADALLAVLGV